ncbi:MAG: thioredoxin fold domain-containing protein [Muribaculaceae bacterium]|nr:thioredoxin fold domain-containing protein [Muribaculaceae bacterium]
MKTLKKLSAIAMLAIVIILTSCSGANAEVKVLAPGEKLEITKPERLMIIDFNATWCGPCVAFGPIFEEAAKKYGNKVDFYSVDVDQHQQLAQQLNIRSIPAILFVHPDGTRDWSIGLMSAEEFDQRIQDALAGGE